MCVNMHVCENIIKSETCICGREKRVCNVCISDVCVGTCRVCNIRISDVCVGLCMFHAGYYKRV